MKYTVFITPEMREEAERTHDPIEKEGDRDEEQAKQDAVAGRIAELVFEEWADEHNVPFESKSEWEWDYTIRPNKRRYPPIVRIRIPDRLKVDVKLRDFKRQAERDLPERYSDLLVRQKVEEIHSDKYLQVVLDEGWYTAQVRGWATREQVEEAEPATWMENNPRLVPAEELQPMP